jgi:hypothetical protein
MDIVAKLRTFVEKSKIKVSKMADMERDNHLTRPKKKLLVTRPTTGKIVAIVVSSDRVTKSHRSDLRENGGFIEN